MMTKIFATLIIIVFSTSIFAGQPNKMKGQFQWEELTPLELHEDKPLQLDGSFLGSHNGAVIVAGGISTADGQRVSDDIYILSKDQNSQWQWIKDIAFKLPKPLAWGAAVNTEKGMVCIGGADKDQTYSDVYILRWNAQTRQVEVETLPSLPEPRAFITGAIAEDVIYVAGGKKSLDDNKGTNSLWALHLSNKTKGWQVLGDIPGSPAWGRIAVVQSDGLHKCLYLFGGVCADHAGQETVLAESYCYKLKESKWKKITDFKIDGLDSSNTRLVSAVPYGEYHILFAGDTKSGAVVQAADAAGVRSNTYIFTYHTLTNTWVEIDEKPNVAGTVHGLFWRDGTIIVPYRNLLQPQSIYSFLETVPERKEEAISFGFLNWLVLTLYLLSMLGVGVYFSKKEKTTGDFFVAGKRIPWWAAGLSIYGTMLSSVTMMAIPATTYRLDWLTYVSGLMIMIVAPIITKVYLPFFRRTNITTAYEYLELRFNLASRLYGSALFILIQLGRQGVVLVLPALALSTVTGMSPYVCIILMGSMVTIYTVIGGIEAVVWTDVMQVIVLFGGAVASLAVALLKIDCGLGEAFGTALADGKFRLVKLGWDYTEMTLWVIIIGNILQNLIPYTADQAIVQRYLTTPSEKAASKAIWTNAFMSIFSAIVFFGLGTALYVFYKFNPERLDPRLPNDSIFSHFISNELPIGMAGLVVAGIFAAAQSTVSGSINSVSTAITTDFYKRFARPGTNDRKYLSIAKWWTGVFGVFCTCVALLLIYYGSRIESLWFTATRIMGLLGGGLAGMFALGIFTKFATGRGALAGALIAGCVQFYIAFYTDTHFYLYAGTGIVVCFVSGCIMSLILGGPKCNVQGNTIYTIRKTLDS